MTDAGGPAGEQVHARRKSRTDLERWISELARGRSLDGRDRLADRLELMDLLEASVLIGAGGARTDGPAILEAKALYARMESINRELYEQMRSQIRRGEVPDWPGRNVAVAGREGYDYLDALVNGVLRPDLGDADIADLAADMVPYQPTPARHIFDLIRRAELTSADVFVDIGSGLGHVPLMVNICTGARSIGIELQPAYVDCARRVARGLNLAGVSFLNEDARAADLSSGTVFYLYTPFKGAILRTVLDSMKLALEGRAVRVCTYGPCTTTVGEEPWLRADEPTSTDRVAIFRSRGPDASPS